MLDTREMFEQAIKSFPRWMDIRKRAYKSNGGKYLYAIMEEMDHIREEVELYKKEFHIGHYIGREDEIVDYIYTAMVGSGELELITPELPVTYDIKYFRDNKGVVYHSYGVYDDGFVFLHEEDILNNDIPLEHIVYKINQNEYSAPIKKAHLWNIFDEFALFAGLERFPEETNKELVNRILEQFRRPPNKTEEGLKNAIANAVLNKVPIYPEEIIIEEPSIDNINETVDGIKIIDTMAQFNRDLLRTKQWDRDMWDHDFAHIKYLPVSWDTPVLLPQDGIGQSDDLKAYLSQEYSDQDTVNAIISIYGQREVAIQRYLQNKKIMHEIPLKLERYNDVLNPLNVGFQVEAYPVTNLTETAIEIETVREFEGEREYFVADLVTNHEEVEALLQRRDLLEPEKTYRLRFKPRYTNSSIEIEKCDLFAPDRQDLLVEKDNFVFDNTNRIINKNTFFSHTSTEGAVGSRNIKNTASGMTLEDVGFEGEIVFDISGNPRNKRLYIEHDCIPTKITMENIFIEVGVDIKAFPAREVALSETFVSSTETDAESTKLIFLVSSDIRIDKSQPAELDGDKSGHLILYDPRDELWEDCGNSLDDNYFISEALHDNEESYLRLVEGFEANEVSFKLLSGQCIFKYWLDGNLNEDFIEAGTVKTLSFENPRALKIEIVKHGEDPVVIANMGFKRYNLTYSLDSGTIINIGEEKVIPQTNENLLYIKLEAFTGFAPVIKHVTVDEPMEDYVLEFTTPNVPEPYLDIESNCRVVLEDDTGTVLRENYITKPYYYLAEEEPAPVGLRLSLSNYETFSTDPALVAVTEDGQTAYYYRLSPGEQIDKILVRGQHKPMARTMLLADLLNAAGQLYSSSAFGSFIIGRPGGTEEIKYLYRNTIDTKASSIKIKNLLENISAVFIVKGAEEKGTRTDNTITFTSYFSKIYLYPVDRPVKHVAYPEYMMFRAKETELTLPYNFTPSLEPNIMMLYKIVMPAGSNATAEFEKEDNKLWSLGRKPITVQVNIDMDNSGVYDFELTDFKYKYMLSSSITLQRAYTISGIEQDMAAFIITPPENMEVVYKSTPGVREESFYITSDQFNKLDYSNIRSILFILDEEGNDIKQHSRLLPEEGIVIWEDETYIGQEVTIQYEYLIPERLVFKNIDALYKLIEYDLDALSLKDELFRYNLKDGDIISLNLDAGDRVVVQLVGPPYFSYDLNNDAVKIKRISTDNQVAVYPGYYYQNGREFYYHSNPENKVITHFDGISFVNVQRYFGSILTHPDSSNYLPNTDMAPRRIGDVSYIDLRKTTQEFGLSRFNNITACDNYTRWHAVNMDLSLVQGLNDQAIYFRPVEEKAYAFINISSALNNNSMISLYAGEDLRIFLGREKKISEESLGSLLIEKQTELNLLGDYRQYVLNDYDEDYKYFLVVEGEGALDDIVIKDYVPGETPEILHRKNINKLGFNITETIPQNQIKRVFFDTLKNKVDGAEITKDGIIRTSSSISWGLTKIYDGAKNWDNCSFGNTYNNNTIIRTESLPGTITSNAIRIRNFSYARQVVIKINDLITDGFDGVDIRVLTGHNADNITRIVRNELNKNIVELPRSLLDEFIKLEITMGPHKFIKNIEVLVRYNEGVPVYEEDAGTLLSKIFSVPMQERYGMKSINIDMIESPQDIEFSIRAARTQDEHTVFTDWRTIILDSELKIVNREDLEFQNYRFYQLQVRLNSKDARLKINSFDLEVL